jgi:molybdopterin converting factor small subunit
MWGTTQGDLFRTLCGEYSLLREDFFENTVELKQYVNVLKNGRNIAFLSVLDTLLDAGDTIAIFPSLAWDDPACGSSVILRESQSAGQHN